MDVSIDEKIYGYLDLDFSSYIDDVNNISLIYLLLVNKLFGLCSKRKSVTIWLSTKVDYVTITFVACQAIWSKEIQRS